MIDNREGGFLKGQNIEHILKKSAFACTSYLVSSLDISGRILISIKFICKSSTIGK